MQEFIFFITAYIVMNNSIYKKLDYNDHIVLTRHMLEVISSGN